MSTSLDLVSIHSLLSPSSLLSIKERRFLLVSTLFIFKSVPLLVRSNPSPPLYSSIHFLSKSPKPNSSYPFSDRPLVLTPIAPFARQNNSQTGERYRFAWVLRKRVGLYWGRKELDECNFVKYKP